MVTSLIEFDTPAEHIFDSAVLQLLNDKGQLKSQVLSSELFFANYDTDDLLTTKRGNKTVVFSGVDNTASVSGGVLKFNEDRSLATYAGITGIVDDFAFRTKINALITATAVDRDLVQLVSKATSAKIRLYYQNNGGGDTRVKLQVVNDLGTQAYDIILAIKDLSTSPDCCASVSVDGDGNIVSILDGAVVSTVSTPAAFDFSELDVVFGDDSASKSAADFDDVQLLSENVFTEAYSAPYPEPTTYVLPEQVMETIIPLLVDKISSLDIQAQAPAGSQLAHFFLLDNVPFRWSGTAWEEMDLTSDFLPQANTLAELQAGLATLPIVEGIGKTVYIGHVFKSDSGYATPLIESVTVQYTYTKKPGALPTCVITGTVKDNSGAAVVGAKVWVTSDDQLVNDNLIGPAAYVESKYQGRFSISVPQGITAKFVYEYEEQEPGGATPITSYVEHDLGNKVIPALPTQTIDLLAAA